MDAFQRAAVSVAVPRIGISLCHASFLDYAHEVISAGLKDTMVTLTTYGDQQLELDVTVSTAVQVYVQNFVQLLNVSVLPQVSIHGMVHSSKEGLTVSTVVDPIALYLNHTVMLILSTMDKILAAKPTESRSQAPRVDGVGTEVAETELLLHDMRITLVNDANREIWYRQEGTSECLRVKAHSCAAYSWLSLASDVYYRMEFALEEDVGAARIDAGVSGTDEPASEACSVWSDPCVVKENCVTGRYFKGYGFLWVCVELKGLQTVVTLRPAIIFQNLSDRTVQLRLNDEKCSTFQCGPLSAGQQAAATMKENDSRTQAPLQGDDSSRALMTDTTSRARVSLSGDTWSSPLVLSALPPEFGLVRLAGTGAPSGGGKPANERIDLSSSMKREFVKLAPAADSGDGRPFYGWLTARRAACKVVLPNDFDPSQRHFAQRYAWMELVLRPALAVENTSDLGIKFTFVQKVSYMLRE